MLKRATKPAAPSSTSECRETDRSMWQFIVEKGIGIAGGVVAMAAQLGGYTNVAIALALLGIAAFFFVAPICHHAHAWHKRRQESGLRSVDPSYLLIVGLSGIIVFAAIALAGVFWQFSRGPEPPRAATASISVPTPPPDKPKAKVVTNAYDLPLKLEIIDKQIRPIFQDEGELELHVRRGLQLQSNWRNFLTSDRPKYMEALRTYRQQHAILIEKIYRIFVASKPYEDISELLGPVLN